MIVGSGWVGRQIAARLATFGITVGLTDKDADTIEDAYQWIVCSQGSIQHPLSLGGLSTSTRENEDSTMHINHSLSVEAASGTQETPSSSRASRTFDLAKLVEKLESFNRLTRDQVVAWQAGLAIESVPEQISLKRRVLRRISDLVSEDCIIVSNSSYFVPSLLSQFVQHPNRYAHLHFHVPVLRDSVADIVGCESTSSQVVQRLAELCHRIQQHPLILKREHPGYVFNWLLQSVLKAALELVASDVAEIEDIDLSWKSVTGMSVGPFGMMDQIGIDVIDQQLAMG